MKVILYANGDSTVTVTSLHAPFLQSLIDGGMTEANAILHAAERFRRGRAFEVVDEGQVPTDRTFRNAWEPKAGGVNVNMPRARILQMDKIRVKRAAKFVELDNAHRAADDVNDGPLKAQIAQQRKALRDIPETFDLEVATTPEELAELWPPEVL